MKPSFSGFSFEKEKLTQIPASFFTQILPEIIDANTLKILLYAFWWLEQQEADSPYITFSTFTSDEVFMGGLETAQEKPEITLKLGIAGLVEGSVFLAADIPTKPAQTIYFLNTKKGQAAIKAISQGNLDFLDLENNPITLSTAPINIYQLYEENIGPLTPMLADALKEIENLYSPEWIEDAFREAIKNNVRKLKYIEAILQTWQNEGRNDRTDRGRSKKSKEEDDPYRYIKGKNSDFFNH